MVSEIGTTFNDIQGALFILWGVYLLMPRREDDAISARRALWAGVAFGLAIAVKFTSGYYVVAAVVAMFMANPPKVATRNVTLTCVSAGACALLLCGPWMLWVYHQTGSPMFPLFNEIFQSDWYPPVDYARGYARPQPFMTTLFYPFAWAQANAHLISEVEFRDARFAAAWIAAVGILALMLTTLGAKVLGRERMHPFMLGRPMRFLFAFALAAYVVWLSRLAVLRFGIVPEVLTGTVIVLGIEIITAALAAPRVRAIAVVTVAAGLGIGLQATTIYPSWGRAPYEQRTYTIGAPPLPAHSLVVLAGVPLSFIVPFLRPKDFTAVGISSHTAEARGYRLFEETKKRILGHTGPAFVVLDENSQPLRALAADLGITWSDGPCQRITTNVYAAFQLCPGKIGAAP